MTKHAHCHSPPADSHSNFLMENHLTGDQIQLGHIFPRPISLIVTSTIDGNLHITASTGSRIIGQIISRGVTQMLLRARFIAPLHFVYHAIW